MSCCSTNTSEARRVNAAQTFQPNVDILETQDDWVIVADVPGAARETLDVQFDDGVLKVQAKVAVRQPAETGYLVREYPVGDFERSFRIGEGVDASRIDASLDAGVLTIHLPKAESAKPRKIEVRHS
jgi:HSP20 family protein